MQLEGTREHTANTQQTHNTHNTHNKHTNPIQVNDGSNLSGIQVVLEPTTPGFDLIEAGAMTTGEQYLVIFQNRV